MARLQVLDKDDNGSVSFTNRYSYLYSSDDSSSRLASYCTKRDCSFDPENAVEQGAQYSRMLPRCFLALSSYLPSLQHTIKHLPNSIECYGCEGQYKRYCGMLLQLGGCEYPGGITLSDWIRSDAVCFRQRHDLGQDPLSWGAFRRRWRHVTHLSRRWESATPCFSTDGVRIVIKLDSVFGQLKKWLRTRDA